MVTAFRILAGAIAALVGVQAASHAWTSAGLGVYIENGGVIDKAFLESAGASDTPAFPELLGFAIHGLNGMFVIPTVALVLVVVSFFAKFPRAVTWALAIAGLVAVQVTLGLAGHGQTAFAFLHGLNALLLFGTTILAIRAARKDRRTSVGDSANAPMSINAEA